MIVEDNHQERNRVHIMAILVLTALCMGAILENAILDWEFWMPPLIVVGVIAMWWMHITQYADIRYRENYYLIMALIVAFYLGVHANNFFGIYVISTIIMGVAALLGRKGFLRIILAEYFLVMAVQIVLAVNSDTFSYAIIDILRIGLHLFSAVFICIMLRRMMERSWEKDDEIERLKGRREDYLHDMEDFLVNISHELRTPLNVINGMTDLILRKEDRKDIVSIRNAGIRISGQIEDIQDYSEIQRNDIRLENERYMITSVVNDILINYKSMDVKKNLEFIVDLDPGVPSAMKGDIRKIRKIILHLLDNAFKFTVEGGVCLRIAALKKEYGVNLIIEVTDTGIGMTKKDVESVQKGVYQANKKRTRSTGGIGLGLSIVYGLVRCMDGFVRIESEKNKGTTIRVSIYQEVVDPAPCLGIKTVRFINVIFFDTSESQTTPAVVEMYRNMARNLAAGLRVNLYLASSIDEVKKMLATNKVTHVFMGYREYRDNKSYIRLLSREKVTIAVLKDKDSPDIHEENIFTVDKPVYGLQVAQIINGDINEIKKIYTDDYKKPVLDGIKALVVDDEQMNLVVARGLFGEYNMIVDTAESGREAIDKFGKNDYDVIFMDHMMPIMDGVEAMKRIREIAEREDKKVKIVALTANAVSGAKEMFLGEGFDGFIAKPVNLVDFERVMGQVLTSSKTNRKGGIR